jgi:hypothetical protein
MKNDFSLFENHLHTKMAPRLFQLNRQLRSKQLKQSYQDQAFPDPFKNQYDQKLSHHFPPEPNQQEGLFSVEYFIGFQARRQPRPIR